MLLCAAIATAVWTVPLTFMYYCHCYCHAQVVTREREFVGSNTNASMTHAHVLLPLLLPWAGRDP